MARFTLFSPDRPLGRHLTGADGLDFGPCRSALLV